MGIIATCPAGKVTGGGYYDVNVGTAVIDSYPNTLNSWQVFVNTPGAQDTIYVYAICMTTDPSSVIASLSPAAKKGKSKRD